MRHSCLCALTAIASTAMLAPAQCVDHANSFGNSVTGPVRSIAPWSDAPGQPQRLVIGGAFTASPGVPSAFPCDYVGFWDESDGGAWHPLGWGTDGPVNVVTTWDPDGSGPLGEQVFAAGTFTSVGSDSTGAIAASNIARWDGAAWRPLGPGLNGEVRALTVWDPDGPGPQRALFIAGGNFTHAGSLQVDYIATWDGAIWRPVGWGFDAAVNALVTWDRDGSGAQNPVLLAGGAFTVTGADGTGEVISRGVASWDGTVWASMSAPYPNVTYLATFDLDGSGADAPLIFAQNIAGASDIQRWNGVSWQSAWGRTPPGLGLGSIDPRSMRTADVGGDRRVWFSGPTLAMSCDEPEGGCIFIQLPPTTWWESTHGVGWGPTVDLTALAGWDPDGIGPAPAQLAAAEAAPPFLRSYRTDAPPDMSAGPRSTIVPVGGSATFELNLPFPSGVGPGGWYRALNGYLQQLHDGPFYTGSTISGSRTTTLTIHNVTVRDAEFAVPSNGSFAARYVYVGYTQCGQLESDSVRLEIARCSADFNADGDTGTDADIEAFFACLAGSCCDTCSSADFNGDGDSGTDADIESFFRVLAGGLC